MIYILLCTITLLIVIYMIYFDKTMKDFINLSFEVEDSSKNADICKKMLDMIGNNHTNVEYNKDEKTNLSYYNHSKDTIVLKSKNDGGTRFIHIAHECIHTTQKKKFLIANKAFSNLQIIYFLISLIYIGYNGGAEMPIIAIQILLLIGTLFVKVVIEGDASYRSVDLAEEYLLTMFDKEKVKNYISKIRPFIYNLMPIYYYNFLSQGLIMVIVNLIIVIVI